MPRAALPSAVFEITIERDFPADHAITIGGERERPHRHQWLVRATIAGENLSHEDVLCDFHEVERALDAILGPWRNASLNDQPPFNAGKSPTAEAVARLLAHRLADALAGRLPPGARVARVAVTEAPGCVATYSPGPAP